MLIPSFDSRLGKEGLGGYIFYDKEKMYLPDIKYMLKSCPDYRDNEIGGAFELTCNCTNSLQST